MNTLILAGLATAVACAAFAARLRADRGAWRGFYGEDEIMAALAALTAPT